MYICFYGVVSAIIPLSFAFTKNLGNFAELKENKRLFII